MDFNALLSDFRKLDTKIADYDKRKDSLEEKFSNIEESKGEFFELKKEIEILENELKTFFAKEILSLDFKDILNSNNNLIAYRIKSDVNNLSSDKFDTFLEENISDLKSIIEYYFNALYSQKKISKALSDLKESIDDQGLRGKKAESLAYRVINKSHEKIMSYT